MDEHDDIRWMEQPYQQQQANAGGGSEDGAGEGDAGGGEGEGGEQTRDLDAELAEAIDAGIEEGSGRAPDKPAESKDGEGEGEGDGAASGNEGEGEPEGEGKAGDGKEDEDGKPAKPTEPDHVNDPIPDEVKGRTRERMEALVGKVKDTTTQLEQVQGQYNEIMGMISETGATPDQYGMVLEYLGAVNSGDPEQIRGAMKTLQTELDALAEMLGETAPGKDPLDGHQDLQDAVEVGDITQAHAEELAKARNQQAAASRRTQASDQQRQQQTEQERVLEQGKADLNALEAELKASDPQYPKKRAALIEVMKPVMGRVHPSQWAATWKDAYEKFQLPAVPAPNNGGQGDGQQPLRARQPAGGQQKAPTSLEEAIDFGIQQARAP